MQDTPQEIAADMLRTHPAKAKRVGAAILAQSKSTVPTTETKINRAAEQQRATDRSRAATIQHKRMT